MAVHPYNNFLISNCNHSKGTFLRSPLILTPYNSVHCIVSMSTAVVTRALSRTNPASTWNLQSVFQLHLKLHFFSQKRLQVPEFLAHTDVLCDRAPVFRDPIDLTFCTYCHSIELPAAFTTRNSLLVSVCPAVTRIYV
jgi:hypothetical protein